MLITGVVMNALGFPSVIKWALCSLPISLLKWNIAPKNVPKIDDGGHIFLYITPKQRMEDVISKQRIEDVILCFGIAADYNRAEEFKVQLIIQIVVAVNQRSEPHGCSQLSERTIGSFDSTAIHLLDS
jgi:hypothetical protein